MNRKKTAILVLIFSIILIGAGLFVVPLAASTFYFKKGESARQAKRYNEAIAYFQKSLQWNSKNGQAWYKLALSNFGALGGEGLLAYRRSLPPPDIRRTAEEMISALDRAEALGVKSAQLYYSRAFAKHFLVRNQKGAWRDAEEALRLDPNFARAYFILGDIKIGVEKNLVEGITLLEKARSLRPDDPMILGTLSLAYARIGSEQKAEIALQEAAEASPNDWRTWNNLADIQYRQGRYQEALESARKALAINAERNFITYGTLGEIYEAMGNKSEAIANYEKFLEYRERLAKYPDGNDLIEYIEMRLNALKSGRRPESLYFPPGRQ